MRRQAPTARIVTATESRHQMILDIDTEDARLDTEGIKPQLDYVFEYVKPKESR